MITKKIKKYIHYITEDSKHSECGLWLMNNNTEEESESIREVTCPECIIILITVLLKNLTGTLELDL